MSDFKAKKKQGDIACKPHIMRRSKKSMKKGIDCWVCDKKGYILYGKIKVKCKGCMGTGKMIQEIGIGA
jgi:hypothetical protein